MKYLKLLCVALILVSHHTDAQTTTVTDTITRSAPIFYDVLGNKVQYGAQMPELNQIAGAPKAFYTYYWEFGDGNYSFQEKPEHAYKKKGEYEVKLWSTNNYDNGKPPASRPKKVAISNATDEEASIDNSAFTEADPSEDLLIKTNRDPVPEQEMVVICPLSLLFQFIIFRC